MGYRNQDGTWHDRCLDKVKPNEPIFVLRAQDKLAPRLVRLWAEMAADADCPVNKVEEAFATADEMEGWAWALLSNLLTVAQTTLMKQRENTCRRFEASLRIMK